MMFEWAKVYDTGIDLVDQQHHRLFDLINALAANLEHGESTEDRLELALNELLDYAHGHFVDEEMEMARYRVDKRHQTLQRMEHQSFIYDVNKMRDAWDNVDLVANFEKLLRFITSWLVYHTLRTDQLLGIQVAAIREGQTPAAAYEFAERSQLNPRIYQQVVKALVELWSDALERVSELEEREREGGSRVSG